MTDDRAHARQLLEEAMPLSCVAIFLLLVGLLIFQAMRTGAILKP